MATFWVAINESPECFFHPIFSSFGFWYSGHYLFPSCPSCLAKFKKNSIIFSYFHNFVLTISDQKQKTKNGMNETLVTALVLCWCMHTSVNSATLVWLLSSAFGIKQVFKLSPFRLSELHRIAEQDVQYTFSCLDFKC